eukprot:5917502-Pleurochrysis_carterae.AAC.2
MEFKTRARQTVARSCEGRDQRRLPQIAYKIQDDETMCWCVCVGAFVWVQAHARGDVCKAMVLRSCDERLLATSNDKVGTKT